MRNWILLLALTLSASVGLASGDLGGGGSLEQIQREFRLTDAQIRQLQNVQGNEQAFQEWLSGLDGRQKQRMMKKIFKLHILPQLN